MCSFHVKISLHAIFTKKFTSQNLPFECRYWTEPEAHVVVFIEIQRDAFCKYVPTWCPIRPSKRVLYSWCYDKRGWGCVLGGSRIGTLYQPKSLWLKKKTGQVVDLILLRLVVSWPWNERSRNVEKRQMNVVLIVSANQYGTNVESRSHLFVLILLGVLVLLGFILWRRHVAVASMSDFLIIFEVYTDKSLTVPRFPKYLRKSQRNNSRTTSRS